MNEQEVFKLAAINLPMHMLIPLMPLDLQS